MLRDLSALEPPNVEYSDFERELLAAGRSEVPDAALEARMLAPLSAVPGAAAPAEAPVTPGWASFRPGGLRPSHLWGGVAAGTAALALGLLVGLSGSPTSEPRAPARKPASAERFVETNSSSSAEVRANEASVVAEPVAARTPPRASTKERSSTVRAAGRAPKAERVDSLGEELRLLDAARAALARGEGAKASRLLEHYGARFPEGQLRSEARVLAERLGRAPR